MSDTSAPSAFHALASNEPADPPAPVTLAREGENDRAIIESLEDQIGQVRGHLDTLRTESRLLHERIGQIDELALEASAVLAKLEQRHTLRKQLAFALSNLEA